jgi:hypothetical protein
MAAITFIAASVPAFYASLGIDLVFNAAAPGSGRAEAGWRILLVGLAWVLLAFAYVALLIASARALRLRRHYPLVLATAVASLLLPPFGTALGIATLLALRDPEVRQAFGRAVAHRGPRGG